MHKKFSSEKLKRRDHLVDPDVGGKIILEWILGKLGGRVWTRFIWLKLKTSDGFL
jgi:hypothetical protein